MKKITTIALCIATLLSFQACKSQPAKIEGISKGQMDSVSYALGVWFGLSLKQDDLGVVNFNVVNKAIQDALNDKELKVKPEEIGQVIQAFIMKRQEIASEKNQKAGAEFLALNRTKEGVIELPSGLQYKIIEEGSGIQPDSPTDTVTVHYKGTIIDGTQFDSSYDREMPYTTALNNVIPGWTEGFQLLKEGTKAIFYIPADLAYGPQQRSAEITPYSTLIFEVELISVSKTVPQPENK